MNLRHRISARFVGEARSAELVATSLDHDLSAWKRAQDGCNEGSVGCGLTAAVFASWQLGAPDLPGSWRSCASTRDAHARLLLSCPPSSSEFPTDDDLPLWKPQYGNRRLHRSARLHMVCSGHMSDPRSHIRISSSRTDLQGGNHTAGHSAYYSPAASDELFGRAARTVSAT